MSALAATPRHLSDHDLILAVTEKAAFAEAEIEAAYRFREGTDVRDWHLERADTATVELLGLINGPQYRVVWERLARLAEPVAVADYVSTLPQIPIPSRVRPVSVGGLA